MDDEIHDETIEAGSKYLMIAGVIEPSGNFTLQAAYANDFLSPFRFETASNLDAAEIVTIELRSSEDVQGRVDFPVIPTCAVPTGDELPETPSLVLGQILLPPDAREMHVFYQEHEVASFELFSIRS